MASILSRVSRTVSWHVYCLFDHLDPVASSNWVDADSKAESSSWDNKFLFPVLLLIFASLYGTLGMEYASSEGGSFKFSQMANSSIVFNHQIASPDIWLVYDKALALVLLASIAMFISFWKRPFALQKYQQTVDKHGATYLLFAGKGLSKEVSVEILKYRKQIKRLSNLSLGCFVVALLLFFYGNVFLNDVYEISLSYIFMYLILLPLWSFYLMYAMFGIATFLILASLYGQIQQKELLSRLQSFICELSKTVSKRKGSKRVQNSLVLQWSSYLTVNLQMVHLLGTISSYSDYWKTPLSIFLLDHITMQCYLIYILVFIDTLSLLMKGIFLYGILEMNVITFLLIAQCARTVKVNQAFERANRHFNLKFQQTIRANHIPVPAIRLLKGEWLQSSHRLHPYAFRIFDNTRITSKTFYMVFSQLSPKCKIVVGF